MINDQDGVNGRKINFISYDDGYSPPKTVEQVRKLIESDEVFLVFNALGTPTQTAVQKYQNGKPAGLEASEGILSAGYLKDASDAQWANDEGMKKFMAFIDKYMPGSNISDANMVYGYSAAQTMVQVLKQAGDNLTRENVMKQAARLKDFAPDTVLPGIKLNTSATDYAPIEQLQMMQFKGGKWELFGDIISAEAGG
jgi:ABC-type branched-subunit amino acid transport system substrate-binding protein